MEWDNLNYVDMADLYYGAIAFKAENAMNINDILTAQQVKIKIAKLLLACLSAEPTQLMIRLIGKIIRLDYRICKFILIELRAEFVALNPQEN